MFDVPSHPPLFGSDINLHRQQINLNGDLWPISRLIAMGIQPLHQPKWLQEVNFHGKKQTAFLGWCHLMSFEIDYSKIITLLNKVLNNCSLPIVIPWVYPTSGSVN